MKGRETNPDSGWKYVAGMELEQTVVEQYRWILGLAKKYCRNAMDAEDLAGETICKILCNKGKFDPGRSFRPWCSVIMLNTYITSYNRNSSVRFESEERASVVASPGSADDMLLVNELERIIEECREVSCAVDCALMYAEGYSYDEIAHELEIPCGTVRSRISYARNMIRKRLSFKS